MEKYGKTNTLEGTYDDFLTIKKDLERLEQLEIAKNMKADGQPLDLIAKFTGLTIEEIEKL